MEYPVHMRERERKRKKERTQVYGGNIRELLLAVILPEKSSPNYITDLSPANRPSQITLQLSLFLSCRNFQERLDKWHSKFQSRRQRVTPLKLFVEESVFDNNNNNNNNSSRQLCCIRKFRFESKTFL